jgi:hypothetical protein
MPEETTSAAPKLRYEDNPNVAECFADSIGQWIFDGQTLRIEFTVTRLDEGKAGAQRTGRRLPVARLVLTPLGAVDLINRSRQLVGALEKAGLVKPSGKTAQQTS